jgi:hypothetical protein
MAIEAFLNNYGTKCLGEDFYKQNMERLRITQKIAVLIASCKNNLIDKNDPLIKKVQTFFEARNQLVHPKSREIDFDRIDDFSNKNPKELKIIEIIEDMEQILSQICEMDPDINFDIEFPKPNKANS